MDQLQFGEWPQEKRCNKCGVTKPIDDFYAMVGMRDGHRNDCKACNLAAKKARYLANPQKMIERARDWQKANPERHLENQRRRRQRPDVKRRDRDGYLRRKYGITLEQYDAMFEGQGGVCAICGRPPREDISLHVDHDHDTGEVRGLLCFRCNNAIGDLGHDLGILEGAVAYLDRPDIEEVAATRARLAELVASTRR
jgi:hypothetical protein